jgi:5-methyltetrahydrofolate--homocysteine methyltransferase
MGLHTVPVTVGDIRPFINWRVFFSVWKIGAGYASIADMQGCDHCKAVWLASFPSAERAKAAEAKNTKAAESRILTFFIGQRLIFVFLCCVFVS